MIWPDGHPRIERAVRVLEDDLDLAAQRLHPPGAGGEQVLALERDLAGGRLLEPEDEHGRPWSCRSPTRRPARGFRRLRCRSSRPRRRAPCRRRREIRPTPQNAWSGPRTASSGAGFSRDGAAAAGATARSRTSVPASISGARQQADGTGVGLDQRRVLVTLGNSRRAARREPAAWGRECEVGRKPLDGLQLLPDAVGRDAAPSAAARSCRDGATGGTPPRRPPARPAGPAYMMSTRSA